MLKKVGYNYTISVCIPTYSRLEYLKQAVSSCLKQTYPHFEICVSQDPKPDGADENIRCWCMEQQKKYQSKFRYNLNGQRLGIAGNWNVVANMAKGDYIIIIGDDDILSENFLSEMVGIIENNENISVVFCNQFFIDENGILLEQKTEELNDLYGRNSMKEGFVPDAAISLFQKNCVPSSAALIRSDYFTKYLFDSEVNTPEIFLFLKIAFEGGEFYYHAKQLQSFRLHTQSATAAGLKVHIHKLKMMELAVPPKYKAYYDRYLSGNGMVSAVNSALKDANKKLALKFLMSKYYPVNKFHYRIIQVGMLSLPKSIINKLLK